MDGKQALAEIERILGALRGFADAEDWDGLVAYGRTEANIESLVAAVADLDLYLTRKQEGRDCHPRRRDDHKNALALCAEGAEWTVYLSDGGYSRLVLRFAMPGWPLVAFDSGSGGGIVQSTRDRWLALKE